MRYRAHTVLLSLVFLISPQISQAQPLTVSTIAGQFGNSGYVNLTGTNALFVGAAGVLAADVAGNLFVLDGAGVRKIDANLSVTTFAGHSNIGGYFDAPNLDALFDVPSGDIAVDLAGNLYVAESQGNYDVRKISGGNVSTLAGNNFVLPAHVNGTGTNALFMDPHAITVDAKGNVYVGDGDFFPKGALIRKITPDGVVTTFAGSGVYGNGDGQGTNAQISVANGLAADTEGNIYVADGWGVRIISPSGDVRTWAGNPNNLFEQDGVGTNAGFGSVDAQKIVLDGTGGAYVTGGDTIRYISAKGVVTTVAGVEFESPTNSDDGVGSGALFENALGITMDASRNLYVTDAGEDIVLKCMPPPLAPISSFGYSTGGAPVQTSNPWKFFAIFTNIVSDVRLRVQSTTNTANEGTWADLPGDPTMTDVDGNWTLNTTDIPAGTRSFRVVASAPGYFDSKSAAVGPENVVPGMAPFGQFVWKTGVPFRNFTPWTFTITEASAIPGLQLKVQDSGDQTNWQDLPVEAQMTNIGNGQWTLTTSNISEGPTFFRVVASAPGFFDHISANIGPFNISPPLPTEHQSSGDGGGNFSLDDVPAMQDPAVVQYDVAVAKAGLLLFTPGNVQQFLAAIELAAEQLAQAEISIGLGQVVTIPAVSLGQNATMLLQGTINGDVGLIGQGGSTLIGQGGSTIVSGGGGNLTFNGGTQASIVAAGGGNLVGDAGGAIVSAGGGNLVGNAGGAIVSGGGGNVQPAAGGSIIAAGGGNLVGNAGGAIVGGGGPNIAFPTATADAFATLVSHRPSGGPQRAGLNGTPFTGQMVINGNFNLNDGNLFIGIAGTSTAGEGAQQFDQLVVSGTANLVGGTIAVGLFNPNDQTNLNGVFQPVDGTTFDVVVASNILVDTIHLSGQIWGDGLFFTGKVVLRPDGLEALELTATHVSPRLYMAEAGSNLSLIYATNFVGYTIQSTASLENPHWTNFSTGTNVVPFSAATGNQFFRLVK